MDWIIVFIILLVLIIVMIQSSTSNYDTDWRFTMKRGSVLYPMTGDDLKVFSNISDDDYVNYSLVVLQDDPYFVRTYPTILHGLIAKDNQVYFKNFISELSKGLRNGLIAYEARAAEFELAPRTVSEIRSYLPRILDLKPTDKDTKVFQAMSTLTDAQLLFAFNRMYVAVNIDPMLESLIIYEPVNKNLSKFLNEKVLSQTAEVQKNIDYVYINTYIKPYLPTTEFIGQQANTPPSVTAASPVSPSSASPASPSSAPKSPSPAPKSPSPASPSPETKTASSSSSSTGLLYGSLSSSCSLVLVALLFMVVMKKKSAVK